MAKAAQTEIKRVGRFGITGILNTVIAFSLFQGITKVFSIPLDKAWMANLPAGAFAMAFSFVMNRVWVFKRQGQSVVTQAIQFFPVTAIGIFVIQTGLIKVFTSYVPQVGQLAFQIGRTLGLISLLPNVLTEAFVIKTVAFGLGTLASLTWNYLVYKHWVFKK